MQRPRNFQIGGMADFQRRQMSQATAGSPLDFSDLIGVPGASFTPQMGGLSGLGGVGSIDEVMSSPQYQDLLRRNAASRGQDADVVNQLQEMQRMALGQQDVSAEDFQRMTGGSGSGLGNLQLPGGLPPNSALLPDAERINFNRGSVLPAMGLESLQGGPRNAAHGVGAANGRNSGLGGRTESIARITEHAHGG